MHVVGSPSYSGSESEDKDMHEMRELLDHSIATESTLDPSYLSEGLPECSCEDVLERSSLISSESVLETSTLLDQSFDDNTSHTAVPVSTSTPQSQPRSSQGPVTACAEWHGFKVVGDNIDKTVKPRYMSEDTGTQSLHYFHSYAVRDRLNLHNCSDLPPNKPGEWSMENYKEVSQKVLPNHEDHHHLQDDFIHIMTRVIVERIAFFQQFDGIIQKHIPHAYSKEMGQKSEVVSTFL